jgi:uncharacterized protein YlxW (UPF0749 family)
MSDGALLQWLTSAAPPAYALLLGSAVLAVRFWPVWKQRLTEAKTADDAIVGNQWKRFQEEIDRLVKRVSALENKCQELEREVQDCHDRETRERSGRLEAEAMLLAQGEARKQAAGIVAVERAEDRLDKAKDVK